MHLLEDCAILHTLRHRTVPVCCSLGRRVLSSEYGLRAFSSTFQSVVLLWRILQMHSTTSVNSGGGKYRTGWRAEFARTSGGWLAIGRSVERSRLDFPRAQRYASWCVVQADGSYSIPDMTLAVQYGPHDNTPCRTFAKDDPGLPIQVEWDRRWRIRLRRSMDGGCN